MTRGGGRGEGGVREGEGAGGRKGGGAGERVGKGGRVGEGAKAGAGAWGGVRRRRHVGVEVGREVRGGCEGEGGRVGRRDAGRKFVPGLHGGDHSGGKGAFVLHEGDHGAGNALVRCAEVFAAAASRPCDACREDWERFDRVLAIEVGPCGRCDRFRAARGAGVRTL